jgi:ATP-dependent DNA ligase
LSENSTVECFQDLDRMMADVLSHNGEGLIVRRPSAQYECLRSHNLLKVKRADDDEGIITGFTTGRETDKGSRNLGKIGAIILDYNGKRLEMSGLTDEERLFATPEGSAWAAAHPSPTGKSVDVPSKVNAKHFKRGEQITFIYRGKTDSGLPSEARYFRKREIE